MYPSVGESQDQSSSWPWDVDRICVLLLRELDRCRGWRTQAGIISLGRPQSSQELRLVRTYGSPSWVPDVKGTILTDKIICFLLIKDEFQYICQLISWASAPGLPRIPRWGLFLWGDPAAFLQVRLKGPVTWLSPPLPPYFASDDLSYVYWSVVLMRSKIDQYGPNRSLVIYNFFVIFTFFYRVTAYS